MLRNLRNITIAKKKMHLVKDALRRSSIGSFNMLIPDSYAVLATCLTEGGRKATSLTVSQSCVVSPEKSLVLCSVRTPNTEAGF
jgi:hypothetical protein